MDEDRNGSKVIAPVRVDIYVSSHCEVCEYSYEVAAGIRRAFPQVTVEIIDLQETTHPIPEAVFATPTYLLNGQLWSLGNPSPQEVHQRLSRLVAG